MREEKMNPFEIQGPTYLLVYFAICGIAFMLSKALKAYLLRDPNGTSPAQISSIARSLQPYEAAYLSGGSERVFLAACAALSRHNLVEVSRGSRKLYRKLEDNTGQFKDLEYVEQALLVHLSKNGESISTSRAKVNNAVAGIVTVLENYGLKPTTDQLRLIRFIIPLFYASVVLFFSLPKCALAAQLHLPFTFLLIESIIALAITVKLFRPEGEITAKGAAVNEALRQENSALKLTHSTNPDGLSLRDSALAYGLFGAMAIGDPFNDAHYALRGQNAAGSTGSGSSCGSGTSCGSSCGGGCGGGCGG